MVGVYYQGQPLDSAPDYLVTRQEAVRWYDTGRGLWLAKKTKICDTWATKSKVHADQVSQNLDSMEGRPESKPSIPACVSQANATGNERDPRIAAIRAKIKCWTAVGDKRLPRHRHFRAKSIGDFVRTGLDTWRPKTAEEMRA